MAYRLVGSAVIAFGMVTPLLHISYDAESVYIDGAPGQRLIPALV